MKHSLFILVGCLQLAPAVGQTTDSLEWRAREKFMRQQSKFDSASDRINHAIDSVQMKSNAVLNKDLTGSLGQMIQKQNLRIDSMHALRKIDSVKSTIRHKIDSLSTLDLPSGKYSGQLDSLVKVKRFGEVKDEVYDFGQLPQHQIDKIRSIEEVQRARGKADEVNNRVDKAQAYQRDAAAIAKGKLGELEAIPQAIENRVASLDEVKDLQTQTGELSKYQDMIASGNNPEAIKAQAKNLVLTYATDHFAGKQEVLKSAMDKVAKLKGKYSQVAGMKDLAKRLPNPMKGKPFIERFIPGVTIQIQKSSTFMIDLSPTIAYRFTDRFSSGVGWNERLSFSEWNKLVPNDRIFGPRLFSSFALRKGFSVKAEVEKMNVYRSTFGYAEGGRVWVWSAFAGFKKDYTLYNRIKGNVQVLYNLYDDHDNSPYLDRLNVRMGFEIGIRKKSKPRIWKSA